MKTQQFSEIRCLSKDKNIYRKTEYHCPVIPNFFFFYVYIYIYSYIPQSAVASYILHNLLFKTQQTETHAALTMC